MISFAAIVPHPPAIIPGIGKNNLELLKKTVEGMKKLERKIKKINPDTILIISPHGTIFSDAFSFNLSEHYESDFRQFGDIETEIKLNRDVGLLHKIYDKLETTMPVAMVSNKILDHGASVPLYYLVNRLKNVSIIPIGYSFLDYSQHISFGKKIREELLSSNKKIAIIASGDLSHRLTFDAPAGYNPQGKIFDDKLINLLKKKNIKQILGLDQSLIEDAGECGLRSILILLGMISDLNYKSELLSYEGPFGVGYLVMNFKI